MYIRYIPFLKFQFKNEQWLPLLERQSKELGVAKYSGKPCTLYVRGGRPDDDDRRCGILCHQVVTDLPARRHVVLEGGKNSAGGFEGALHKTSFGRAFFFPVVHGWEMADISEFVRVCKGAFSENILLLDYDLKEKRKLL